MNKKVSLVLSGGSARGIAHIGVIEELQSQGYEIHSVAGTSMGAFVGGVFALGKMDEVKDWLCSLDKTRVFSLIDFTLSSQGLIRGDKVLNTIKEFTRDANIEELKIGYIAVATDIRNRKEVVFTEGSVFDAIRASIAIPTVLTPVKTEEGLLVDGGVLNNLPLDHAIRIPGDILVAVNVNSDIPYTTPDMGDHTSEEENDQSLYHKKIREFYKQLHKINPFTKDEKLGYFELINSTLGLMTNHIVEMSIEKYKPDILIEISRDACKTFDFYKAAELIETGRRETKICLSGFKSTQEG